MFIYASIIRDFLDWKYLIVFLAGILFGFLLLLLIYVYSVLVAFRKKRRTRREPEEIDKIEIDLMIKNAQKIFQNKQLRKETGVLVHMKNVCVDLAMDISKIYFPTSKYPLLELSVEETLLLSHYITERINDFFDAKLLAPFKKRTITQIKSMYDTKVRVDDLKVVEASKKVGVGRVGKTIMGVFNALNPAYWVRRVTVDQLYDFMLKRISLEIVRIVGEETYKIYSKSVFKEPEELYFDIDELYEELLREEEEEQQ